MAEGIVNEIRFPIGNPVQPPARPIELAEQLTALRRLAAVVAEGADPQTVFRIVADEASRVLGIEAVSVIQFHPETRTLTKLYGTHGDRAAVVDGSSWPIEAAPDAMQLIETGGPVRVDSWRTAQGEPAERHRALGFGESIAAPIIVRGVIWGWIGAYGAVDEILPPNCEHDLADFTNLVATAISNVQARVLAESQGALRRVATLVAQGAEPQTVFTTVAHEASLLLRVGAISLIRFDAADGMLTKIYGTHGHRSPVPDGTTWPLSDSPEASLVVATGGASRVDDWDSLPGPTAERHRAQGFGGAVAAPIIIDGAIWGMLAAYGEAGEFLPPNCAQELADLTNLMASAIANAQARDELRGLAAKQGEALRRVATLVAQHPSSGTVFDLVAVEARRALSVTRVDVCRRQTAQTLKLVGSTAEGGHATGSSTRSDVERVAREVVSAGTTVRIDDLPGMDDLTSAVGAPIRVDGEIWGVIVILGERKLAEGIEIRLDDFIHLVASSIANVNARDNLIASRARVVSAGDDTRRRIERNLHDGVQQRVVSVALKLRAVRVRFPVLPEVQTDLDEIARDLDGLQDEIRAFSQGLHPVLLSRSGLGPALRDLARRTPMIVDLLVSTEQRLPEPVETAIYYVVSEALANTVKHAHASEVSVVVHAVEGAIQAQVEDNGTGGASMSHGSGIIGLVDRVEAIGGRFSLMSQPGRGTRIAIEVPITNPA
jgi:signal transduction histidine kinase